MQHQCYVETDAKSAVVRMPSLVAEMHKAHRERQARIRAAAFKKADDQQVALLEKAIQTTWEDRQKAIPIQTNHWFSIIEMGELQSPRGPLVEDIQRVTCRYFSVTRNDLLSPRRDVRVAYPRHIAMFLAKTLTMKSLPELGRRFGGRDHTTILHGVRKIEGLVLSDWEVAHDVAHVEALI